VTLKGGTQRVEFFWQMTIITLVLFDLEQPSLP